MINIMICDNVIERTKLITTQYSIVIFDITLRNITKFNEILRNITLYEILVYRTTKLNFMKFDMLT